MMTKIARIPLKDREFPDYTRKEEMLNMWSHIFGAGCAVIMMWMAVHASLGNTKALICNIVYVTSVLLMFLFSSIYHGLPKGMSKQVMRVVDHCNIFITIAGTYTPITVLGILPLHPVKGWIIMAVEWGLAIIGVTLNAIDLKKYSKFSMACYLGMGWCVVISLREVIHAMTWPGFMWILLGGLAYTVGALLYHIGKTKPYRHLVFHIFVVLAAVFQFYGIWKYLI